MLEKASLVQLSASDSPIDSTRVEVQFNPAQLRISYRFLGPSSTVRPSSGSGSGNGAAQTNQRTSVEVKLSSLDLFFDTTESGEDVREQTLKLSRFLLIEGGDASPNVRFQWGAFTFKGTIDSMTETIDYFSAEGIPLRASVTLAMTMVEDRRATPNSAGGSGIGASAGLSLGASASVSAGVTASAGIGASANFSAGAAVGTSPLTLAASGETLQSISGRAGLDWKAVASANGIDNPRKLEAGGVLNLNAGASGGIKFG